MANCKYGVLQYVVVKIFASLATATLEPIGLFNEGEFSLTKAYIYVSFMINLSQMWALYCLVKFYHATHDDLASPVNWKPLGKFMCIKGVGMYEPCYKYDFYELCTHPLLSLLQFSLRGGKG